MTWFLKSIGVGGEVLEHLDQTQLAFQRPAVLVAGLLLIFPAAWFIYTRQRNNLATVSSRFRYTLTATRVVILLVLVFVLSGPYLKLDHRITKRPIVAVLFDSSQSMLLPAGPFPSDEQLTEVALAAGYDVQEGVALDAETRKALNRIGRSELAQSVLKTADEEFTKPLADDFELRYYAFGRDVVPVSFQTSSEDGVSVAGSSAAASYVGEAIYRVLDDAAGQPVAAMLLFSDGQNTGGRSPSQAARAAADANAPIFVAPVGSVERLQDVAIVDVYTSGLVAVGDTVRVHATLESVGVDGKPIIVELKDGDDVLDTQELVLHEAAQQQVELTFEAERSGVRYLEINIPVLPDEAEELHANNSDTAMVRISDEKLKVLLIDGHARWDFRFIKNAIRRDNGLTGRSEELADVVLEAEWKRLPDEEKALKLPQTIEQFAEYHTVIIGDASPEILDLSFRKLLLEAVRDKGVGLIVEAGPSAMPHAFDQEFQDLLPVKLEGGSDNGKHAEVYNPYRLEVTPDGTIHEAMRLYDDPGRNQNVWTHMPPYYWCAAVERPAPAASVLAFNSSVETRYGKLPLIAWHYAGEGKVMFVGTDSTWLWRQNVGDRFFYKFWGQSIRFVARKDESAGKKSWVEVRPVRAQPGEKAEVELMAFNADGSPVEANELSLSLLGPGSRGTVALQPDETRKGRFTGSFIPEMAGVHRLVYQPPASGEPTEATIRVLIAPEEYRHPNLNRPTLELLATTSGGDIVELNQLGTIPERLEAKEELKELHREASIWDNWLVLVILIGVYSIDVGIRRLIGLS